MAAKEPNNPNPYVYQLLNAFQSPVSNLQSPLVAPLSQREQEVLQLIVEGYSNREIAEQLVVALSTVKSHINSLYAKLNVSRRTQAIARARELNLID